MTRRSSNLALGIAVGALLIVSPWAFAQAGYKDSPGNNAVPYLAGYNDTYAGAQMAARFRIHDGHVFRPYAFKRHDRDDWRWHFRPYLYYDPDDYYLYGRPEPYYYYDPDYYYYPNYYPYRDFDHDYGWRWRARPEERREFNRGFVPEFRDRAFHGERHENFFGAPKGNRGFQRPFGGGGFKGGMPHARR